MKKTLCSNIKFEISQPLLFFLIQVFSLRETDKSILYDSMLINNAHKTIIVKIIIKKKKRVH